MLKNYIVHLKREVQNEIQLWRIYFIEESKTKANIIKKKLLGHQRVPYNLKGKINRYVPYTNMIVNF